MFFIDSLKIYVIVEYNKITIFLSVWRWGVRNVFDRESKTLLHCHEKTWP